MEIRFQLDTLGFRHTMNLIKELTNLILVYLLIIKDNIKVCFRCNSTKSQYVKSGYIRKRVDLDIPSNLQLCGISPTFHHIRKRVDLVIPSNLQLWGNSPTFHRSIKILSHQNILMVFQITIRFLFGISMNILET